MDVKGKTVFVGMSGGVDSSVSAALLHTAGAKVIGLFMKNWEEDPTCTAEEDCADVAAVCETIGIPFYAVNFSKEYWENVFSHCLNEFKAGRTPNPDILCNKEIKFKVLLEKALALGADFLATGHYAQVGIEKGEYHLLRGGDPDKDQSYFLYTLQSKILEKVLFPIGHLKKSEVRRIATQYQLPTAAKKDSTGICFIGKRNFKPFLSSFIPPQPGNFETVDGKVVGRHDGIAYYTIGQRKGLGIGGAGEAWYVAKKDHTRNTILVVQGENHPALFRGSLHVKEVSFVTSPPPFPFRCTAKIRYRGEEFPCTVDKKEDLLEVLFDTPQKAVTEEQSIVFYNNEYCLGGGVIYYA